jgi:predicted RNase H-like HicB family nuclease
VVIERETGGTYVATFPEWAGCQAQAGSLKTLMVRIQEAMALRPEGPEEQPQILAEPLDS